MAHESDSSNALLVDRVRDRLREEIRTRLQPGDRLPSLREMCRQYGISPSTALNSLKVLEREGLVIRQHGRGTFVTNQSAAQVALLLHAYTKLVDKGDFQRLLAQASIEHGFQINLLDELPPHLELVQDRVRGLITTNAPAGLFRNLVRHGIAVITDSTCFEPGVITLGPNSFQAGLLAAEHLLDAGHTRIGYVGLHNYVRSEKRYRIEMDSELHRAGITEALLKRQIEPDPNLFTQMRHAPKDEGRKRARGTLDILENFLALPEPPTALILFDRGSVEKFMRVSLEKLGLSVPRDLSVVTLGYLEEQTDYTMAGCPFLTFVKASLARLALTLRQGRIDTSQHEWLEVRVDERSSVAKPKK
ncbi:MAG: GntR family transcriptional regulator [Planctomycetota bacterium]|nr:GntR family transcriptional regulator [Planctomycetota bacterium]